MNEVTPEQWRDELLSGRWRRARGQLRAPGSSDVACCLGVLAEMLGCDYHPTDGHLPSDAEPPWLIGSASDSGEQHEERLSWLNDEEETGDRWASDGPVIAYIDEHLIGGGS